MSRALFTLSLATAVLVPACGSERRSPIDAAVDMAVTRDVPVDAAADIATTQDAPVGATADIAVARDTPIDAATDISATQDADPGVARDATSNETSGEMSDEASTVSDLIAQDLYEGKIDTKTAALYQLLAQFSPRRLPPRYTPQQLLAGPPSVLAMLTAKAHLEEYGPVEKAAVQAMLANPEEASWLVFPDDMRVQNFAEDSNPDCWRQFGVGLHGVNAFNMGPAFTTNHFVIQPLAAELPTVPRQAELRDRIAKALDAGQGAYLDAAYEKYKDALKMKEPAELPWVKSHDGKIPIYVGTCDGDNQAFAHQDGFIFVSVEAALEDPDLRRVIIPHETFHLFEFGYTTAAAESPPGSGNAVGWPYDAFAVAAEDVVAPDVRRWSGRFANSKLVPGGFRVMARSFKCPEEPLHSVYHGPCKNRLAPPTPSRYPGDYSKFVLAKFLTRNKGVVPGAFWQKFAAANGDPQKLIEDRVAAEFQLALIGDPPGKPYFDSADRAAFFTAGQTSCDFDTNDKDRYTYWLDPAKMVTSKPLRATPTDDSSGTASLSKLDSTPWPIMPGATHRLLIQVPPSASADKDPQTQLMHVFLRSKNGALFDPYGSNAVAFDAAAKPARTYQLESIVSPHPDELLLNRFASQGLPGFALVLISNFASEPLVYEGAVNFPNACVTGCKKHYEETIAAQGCLSQWCWEKCSTAACEKSVSDCIQKINPSTNDLAVTSVGFFCSILCSNLNGADGLASPELIPCSDACSRLQCFDKKICGTSPCDPEKPAAFYSMSDWPEMKCINWLASGQVKCP